MRAAIALILVLALSGCAKHMAFGDSEVVYEDATLGEAKALGDYLTEVKYFGPERASTVRLDRRREMSHSPPTYRVTFLLEDGAWNDEQMVLHAQNMADDMRRRLFKGEQTLVLLADSRGEEKKKLYAR